MSTRATIACKQDDDRYGAIYLHFDGYPEHAGEMLRRYHNSLDAASALIAGGDMRCFGQDGRPERFADGNRAAQMPTRLALVDFARNCGTQFLYVFEDGRWHCEKL